MSGQYCVNDGLVLIDSLHATMETAINSSGGCRGERVEEEGVFRGPRGRVEG